MFFNCLFTLIYLRRGLALAINEESFHENGRSNAKTIVVPADRCMDQRVYETLPEGSLSLISGPKHEEADQFSKNGDVDYRIVFSQDTSKSYGARNFHKILQNLSML